MYMCAVFVCCARQNKRKVINMSLGGGVNAALDAAVNAAVANGVVAAVAAGNSNSNACSFSPARAADGACARGWTSHDPTPCLPLPFPAAFLAC